MRVLVTGGNGHIGSHVVRAVVERGWTPIAMVRAGSDRRALSGLDVELREADLRDAPAVERAAEGAEIVMHVGAVHANFAADPSTIVGPAVEGTKNVLAAAKKAGARRVVVTSSGSTLGFAEDPGRPLDESAHVPAPKSAYIRGKVESERLALAAAGAGQEVVVLNPSGVFGPRDYRITPATRGIVGLLQGDPAFFAVPLTDVRDVAHAHVRAAERGASGERYVVVGETKRPAETAAGFAELCGIRPPTFRPPLFLMRFLAGREEKRALRDGKDAGLTRDLVADFGHRHLAYDNRKSIEKLGMAYRPAKDVLLDAVRWLLFVDALKPKVAAKVRAALGERAAPDPDWVR